MVRSFKTKEIFQFQKKNLKKKSDNMSTSDFLKIEEVAKLCRKSVFKSVFLFQIKSVILI